MKHKLSKSFKKILGAEQQLEKHDFKNENTTESLGKDPNTKKVNINFQKEFRNFLTRQFEMFQKRFNRVFGNSSFASA